jgi:c-di-GMP-binding flagellar brake protein YcgR
MSGERRKYKRVQASIDVHVGLIFPEESFQPHRRASPTVNISERGMKIRMFDVSQTLYKKMLSPMRYAKVFFTLLHINRNKVPHGKIVWLDYDSQKEGCILGIFFESITHEDQQDVYGFIQMLER